MDVLLSIASRIDHVQHIRGAERYKHVHDMVVKYIKVRQPNGLCQYLRLHTPGIFGV